MLRTGFNLPDFIVESQRTLEEIKTVQQVGANNVIYQTTNTNNQYDYHVVSNTALKKYVITFTTTQQSTFQLVYLSTYYRINNPDVLGQAVEPTAVAPAVSVSAKALPFEKGTVKYEIWILNNSWGITNTTYDIYLKFFFTGTDTGTWALTAV